MQGGKAEKEMKGAGGIGVAREMRGKGCSPFSSVCLTAFCGGGQKESGRGQGQRGRETERKGEKREKA